MNYEQHLKDQNEIMTVAEAAKHLKVSRSTLYKYNYLKLIKFFKPNRGRVLYRKSDLDEFINKGAVQSKDVDSLEAIDILLKKDLRRSKRRK